LKIMIVDDDSLIRDSLKVLLELEGDIDVVGTASNGKEAYEMLNKINPEIVLMDIRMPVIDGVIGTKLIKQKNQNIKVVILTTFKDDEYIKEAIKNGAEGYILKNQTGDSIVESLRAIYRGNVVFEKNVASSVSSMISDNKKKSYEEMGITKREYEIMSLVGDGLSNKEISKNLFLGEGTVRNYITILLEKLNLRDRTQLAIYYLKNFK
jgi:DNA-binding NarL/FixJ family response regulator